MPIDEHRRANWLNWEDRVPVHVGSDMYGIDALAANPSAITGVVDRERDTLPDLTDRDVIHLQCHIGTDTLSLARLGPRSVTGLDFSPSALDAARQLAITAGVEIDFVESEFYDAPAALGERRFDVVYTGTGAINWLPDIRGWARVVAAILRPGGVLHLHDCHPMLFAMGERDDDLLAVEYPYFETVDPIAIDDGPQTYTDGDASTITHTETREWNHGLGEIVQAVIDAGLTITRLEEHQYCDWLALPSVMFEDVPGGVARLRERPERLPLMFTLQARKP